MMIHNIAPTHDSSTETAPHIHTITRKKGTHNQVGALYFVFNQIKFNSAFSSPLYL